MRGLARGALFLAIAAVCGCTSDPPDNVRERAPKPPEPDWGARGARIIDAADSLPQVVATLKAELWSTL